MSVKFLDYNGLSYFWGKIKTLLSGKVNTADVTTYTLVFTLEDDSTVTKDFIVAVPSNNSNNNNNN